MADLTFDGSGSVSEEAPLSKKRARGGGGGDGDAMTGVQSPSASLSGSGGASTKRGYYDAQSVRAGKVPAALSNTAAPTMIYQFDLKAKVSRFLFDSHDSF